MNQQLIKEIENKTKDVQEKINSWKQTLINHENTVLALIEELTKIKQKIEENENMKNNKRSPKDTEK